MKCIKLIICTVLAGLVYATSSFAQTKSPEQLYLALSVSAGGAPLANFTTNDFAMRAFGLQVGVRFKEHLAVFLSESTDLNLININSSKNYNETIALGLGMAYSFPVSKHFAIEPALSCSSTILKTNVNYLAPKLEVRICSHIPIMRFYFGVGAQYLRPYSKELLPNMVMGYCTLGYSLLLPGEGVFLPKGE